MKGTLSFFCGILQGFLSFSKAFIRETFQKKRRHGQITLVEEELLLNLPVVSYHEELCIPSDLYSYGVEEPEQSQEQESPFSALADLKSKLSKE